MRVLLINPMMSSGWKPYMIPPIGLCSLKAAVEKETQHKVRVLDAGGLDISEVKNYIEYYRPHVVGVTTFTEARHNALDVARVAKNYGATVILGGVHATHAWKQIADNYTFVNSICRGEGENLLPWFLDGGFEDQCLSFPMLTNLDKLPIPDYSDLNLSMYIDSGGPTKGKPLAAIETSRGCPYDCAFCSSKSVWGNIRFKSVGRVLEELDNLVDRYQYKMVSFVDDIFTVSKKRTLELCQGMTKYNLNWKCQTRTDRVDKDILVSMKEAGCKLIAFGVESGSPTILENIDKKESPEDIRVAFKLCKEVGIESVFNIIVGSPGETKETLKETRQLIKECNPDNVATAALRAYPGSKIWELSIKEGLFTEDILLTKRESFHYTGAMSLSQMYRELMKFRILQAQLRGFKGWFELIRMGLSLVWNTPIKMVRSVIGG